MANWTSAVDPLQPSRQQPTDAHRGPTYPRETLPADRWKPGTANRTDAETHIGREAPTAAREAHTAAREAHVATQMTITDTAPIHDKTARPTTGHHTLTGGTTGRTTETRPTNNRHLAIREAMTTEVPTRGYTTAALFSMGSGTIAIPAGPGREDPPTPKRRQATMSRLDQKR